MLSTNENFYSMARNVDAVVSKNAEAWKSVKKFGEYADELNGLLELVGAEKESAEIITTGVTADKREAEMKAVKLAVNLSKRTLSYAMDKKDRKLYDQLNVKKSDLIKEHDAELLSKLQAIVKTIKGIGNLSDYGVEPEEVRALAEANKVYKSLLDEPRQMIIDRKGHNQTIEGEHIPAIKDVLQRMDNLVNKFEGTEFEKKYQSARIVIDHGSRGGKKDSDKEEGK